MLIFCVFLLFTASVGCGRLDQPLPLEYFSFFFLSLFRSLLFTHFWHTQEAGHTYFDPTRRNISNLNSFCPENHVSLSSCDAWWMGPTGKGRKGCVNLIVLAEGAILGKYYINFIIIGLNEPPHHTHNFILQL